MSTKASALFNPLKIGSHELSHRLVLAPLTRFRASDEHVPLDYVPEYYAQRASVPGTLLLTEATLISPRASGYDNVPGIWNASQIAGWKTVTDAVHAKGSLIFSQLWALGRVASPATLAKEHGGKYVLSSSSAVALNDMQTPHELTEEEIQAFIAEYAQAARNAIDAGFDGVEIHGANGYLVDQFIQDKVNQRTDRWGGSVENRSRFALEVAKAVVDAVGPEKVGMRLSPWSEFQGMRMDDPIPQFSYVVKGLKDLGLAYVHIVESRVNGSSDAAEGAVTRNNDELIEIWTEGGNARPILLAGGFKPESARTAVDKTYPGANIAIVFGRYWISNPDLAFKIKEDIPLRQYDRSMFYTPKTPKGYIDYEFSKEFIEAQSRL